MIYWLINGKLGGSSIPTRDDLEYWKTIGISAIVSLVEPHEFAWGADIKAMKDMGFDVLWIPVRDMTAPTIEQLEKIVKWIDERIKQGKKVVVHCYGGYGRSGTALAAYLIYSKGLSADEAIRAVRRVRRGAIMTRDQELILFVFEKKVKDKGKNE